MADNNSSEGKREMFTKFKKIELPRNVVIGSDALEKVGDTCDKLELKENAIVICDPLLRRLQAKEWLRYSLLMITMSISLR